MANLLRFTLDDGGEILVESLDEGGGGTTRAGLVSDRMAGSFESALAAVRPALRTVAAQLREVGESADSVQVEFGLKLSAGAGAFIASGSTEAHFRVQVSWKCNPAGG